MTLATDQAQLLHTLQVLDIPVFVPAPQSLSTFVIADGNSPQPACLFVVSPHEAKDQDCLTLLGNLASALGVSYAIVFPHPTGQKLSHFQRDTLCCYCQASCDQADDDAVILPAIQHLLAHPLEKRAVWETLYDALAR